jgi:hypothetical protein
MVNPSLLKRKCGDTMATTRLNSAPALHGKAFIIQSLAAELSGAG